jgi:hypothetical protein
MIKKENSVVGESEDGISYWTMTAMQWSLSRGTKKCLIGVDGGYFLLLFSEEAFFCDRKLKIGVNASRTLCVAVNLTSFKIEKVTTRWIFYRTMDGRHIYFSKYHLKFRKSPFSKNHDTQRCRRPKEASDHDGDDVTLRSAMGMKTCFARCSKDAHA